VLVGAVLYELLVQQVGVDALPGAL
jgi:hypothetical protein